MATAVAASTCMKDGKRRESRARVITCPRLWHQSHTCWRAFSSCGHELWLDIFESSVTALKYEGAATAMLDAGTLCDTGNDAVVLPAPFLLAGGALLSYFRCPCRTSSPKWSCRTLAGLGAPHTRSLTTFQIWHRARGLSGPRFPHL